MDHGGVPGSSIRSLAMGRPDRAVTVFGVLAAYGFIDAVRLIRGSGRTSLRSLVFGEVNDQGGNAAGYLATYLLPFIGLSPKIGVIGPHMSCISLLR